MFKIASRLVLNPKQTKGLTMKKQTKPAAKTAQQRLSEISAIMAAAKVLKSHKVKISDSQVNAAVEASLA